MPAHHHPVHFIRTVGEAQVADVLVDESKDHYLAEKLNLTYRGPSTASSACGGALRSG